MLKLSIWCSTVQCVSSWDQSHSRVFEIFQIKNSVEAVNSWGHALVMSSYKIFKTKLKKGAPISESVIVTLQSKSLCKPPYRNYKKVSLKWITKLLLMPQIKQTNPDLWWPKEILGDQWRIKSKFSNHFFGCTEQGRRNWGGQGGTCTPKFGQSSIKIVLLCPLRISDLELILLRAPPEFQTFLRPCWSISFLA